MVGCSSAGELPSWRSPTGSSRDRPAFGVALAHVWPSAADGGELSDTAAAKALEALGVADGAFLHPGADRAGRPVVIEVAARLGGGHDAELVGGRHRCRPERPGDRGRAGDDPGPHAATSISVGGAVTRFLIAPPGCSRRSRCPPGSRASSDPDLPRAGFEFAPLRRGADRAGAVLVAGGSRSEALAAADAAASIRIRFASEPRSRHGRYASARGGDAAQHFLSFQPPAISEEEIDAVAETLRSGWLTTGPRTAELEARMREYLEAKHVLAVSSCTAALHLSLVALGVGPATR